MSSTDGDLPGRPLVTYRRSRRVDDEDTVPDSEDFASPAQSRPPDDHGGNNPTQSPVNPDESDSPRPLRAVYRSRLRAPSPPSLSYSSMAPVEEVITDSEDNDRSAGTPDDDEENMARKSLSFGLSDWKQKLRDIDDQYDSDEQTQGPREIPCAVPENKGASPKDPFDSPLTETCSLHTSYQLGPVGANESLSSPSHGMSSSTNTTPQFLFGTPQAPSHTPPTSDGKPSPMQKIKRKAKGKGKSRATPESQEVATNDQLPPSPRAIRQTKRSEKQKPKKPKVPSKKELLEARRETARMRSDMRVSISTEATRPLDIKTLLARFDVTQPTPNVRPVQPQSSASEIEAWTSSSPASTRDLGRPETRQGQVRGTTQHTRSASPFRSTSLKPASKYRVVPVTNDNDDPFRTTTIPSFAPGVDNDRGSDSSSDVEMPGIGKILAEKEARVSKRAQKERLQQLKLAALAQQKRASTSAGGSRGAEHVSDDDELDVVPDTMHSVAREEAAARAVAGRTRPSAGRTTQLRLARVPASPQRSAVLPHIPAPSESPEKRMAAAAQPAFLTSIPRGRGPVAKRGRRDAGMSKAELERMVLRSAESQSERLRKEKEEEWVRRGGRVVSVMETVGSEKVQELVGKALKHDEDTHEQGDGGVDADSDGEDDDDDDDDGDYVPNETGSAEEAPMMEYADKHLDDGDDGIAEAAVAGTEVDDSETESESSSPHHDMRPLRVRAARPRRAIIGSDVEDGDGDGDGASGPEHADNEEDVHPPPLSLPDLPSPAFTSSVSPWPALNTEPDHDHGHENDPYVSGNETDKENRAVIRRDVVGPAPTHGARVLFDDILSARTGTKAAAQPLPVLQPSVLADDDPFVFTPSPAKAKAEVLRRLASPTPMHLTGKRGLSQMFEEEEGNDYAPVPALMIQSGGGSDGATLGDADPGLVGFKPFSGGLSQAFEETQDASGSGSRMGGLSALRRGANADFSLTLEAQAAALQPALEVDDRLRTRAAAIFEKEQEYVIEAAQHVPSRASRRELYITENGFLTQTRPEGSSPLVYRPSPSQRPYDALLRSQPDNTARSALVGPGTEGSSPVVTRQPLSTLAESSPTSSSVGREPLRRLRRADISPEGHASVSERRFGPSRGQSLSPSPSPTKTKSTAAGVERTAFTELMVAGAVQRDKAKAKKRSEFVEDQAVESDEDDMLGFGGVRRKGGDDDEDEDDEHDTDGIVKALVDDAHMDEAALARAKVIEKHLEHQTADDARVEKEVQDVVAGKKRTRRHGGAGGLLGSDESDDEDDEEARALRQRLAKKRRVAGDTLDTLARDPATASFHATYQMALVDDAEEFAHLDRDQESDAVPDRDRERSESADEGEEGRNRGDDDGDGRAERVEEEVDEDVEMAGPSNSEKGTISAAEVRKALQDVARGERVRIALWNIAHSIRRMCSWMDQDQDQADEAETLPVRVRMASSTSKVPPHRADLPAGAETDVLSLNRIRSDEQDSDAAYALRMKRWASEEGAGSRHHGGVGISGGGGRSATTGRGVGAGAGAAVTGHRPRADKSSTAKARKVPGTAVDASGTGAGAAAAPVRRTASALSAVADRRGRFGA
ncbi:hypothetical protein F5148DRAFT_1146934 [Russula earlei]|uniref:Uncharacterized protein n=1 Tax=Russula earlei TaxID=71964 RepID=A0ACC0UHQ7_9AGAM|nr:hypothetical protein F5148DRAFT_1146934 [Russula earlei]